MPLIDLNKGILNLPLQTPEPVGSWQKAATVGNLVDGVNMRMHYHLSQLTGKLKGTLQQSLTLEAWSVLLEGLAPSRDELTGGSVHTSLLRLSYNHQSKS